MAGSSSGFNGDEFRRAIRDVMVLGAPPDPSQQVTFYFARQLVYNKPTDDENVPFDPASTVTETAPRSVSVPCALEYTDREGEPVPFGTVTASKVTVTLLDEDYDQVRDFSFLVAGGDRYWRKRTIPPVGLYDVGVFSVICIADNET